MKAIVAKVLSAARTVVAVAGAVAVPVLAFLLRRRTGQLRTAKIEIVRQKQAAELKVLDDERAAIAAKVEADDKDRVTKIVLLRHVLDDGRDPGPRDE